MSHFRHIKAAAIVLWLFFGMIGCSQGDREKKQITAPPTLNSGWVRVEWRGPTSAENPDFTEIAVSHSPKTGKSELIATGVVAITAEVSPSQVEDAFKLVSQAIRSRGNRHIPCSTELPPEMLSTFAGDAGDGAFIQGCMGEEVVAARRALWRMTDKYRDGSADNVTCKTYR